MGLSTQRRGPLWALFQYNDCRSVNRYLDFHAVNRVLFLGLPLWFYHAVLSPSLLDRHAGAFGPQRLALPYPRDRQGPARRLYRAPHLYAGAWALPLHASLRLRLCGGTPQQ